MRNFTVEDYHQIALVPRVLSDVLEPRAGSVSSFETRWFVCFAGFVADSAGAYGPAFFAAGGIMVFGSSLVLLIKFTRKLLPGRRNAWSSAIFNVTRSFFRERNCAVNTKQYLSYTTLLTCLHNPISTSRGKENSRQFICLHNFRVGILLTPRVFRWDYICKHGNSSLLHFVKYFSRKRANQKSQNRVYLLSSKHIYRPIRARVVFQLFYDAEGWIRFIVAFKKMSFWPAV